jgi:hypothetical protein
MQLNLFSVTVYDVSKEPLHIFCPEYGGSRLLQNVCIYQTKRNHTLAVLRTSALLYVCCK